MVFLVHSLNEDGKTQMMSSREMNIAQFCLFLSSVDAHSLTICCEADVSTR